MYKETSGDKPLENMSLSELQAEVEMLKKNLVDSPNIESQVRLSVAMALIYQMKSHDLYMYEQRQAQSFPKLKGKSGKVWFVPPKNQSLPPRVFYVGRSGKICSAALEDMEKDLEGATVLDS